MATKYKQVLNYQSDNNSDKKYSNINLNQNYKCSNMSPFQSDSKLKSKNKQLSAFVGIDNYGPRKEKSEKSWKKNASLIGQHLKMIELSKNYHDNEANKRWKNNPSTITSNNSTLSLHIAAYENLSESNTVFIDEKIESLKSEKFGFFQKTKYSKQLFSGLLPAIKSPFEFPRQQEENQPTESEMMQFKASQYLLNPLEEYYRDRQFANQSSATSSSYHQNMGDSGNDKKLAALSMNGSNSINGNSAVSAHQQVILEQERFMPIANISRIMKRVLPEHAKLSKESKECIQECITEFFLFITSEAAEKCNAEKRKTITGEDLLASMETLGFDNYLLPLRAYLKKFKEATRSERPPSDLDESAENHGDPRSTYSSPPSQQVHLIENYQQQAFVLQQPETINHHQQQHQQPQQQQQNHQQQSQQQNEDVDDIINYLPPNFRRVTEIYVDTITEQHYISATSPGGTTGLIPIQLQATSIDGPPQPISVQTFAQQQNRQTNGH